MLLHSRKAGKTSTLVGLAMSLPHQEVLQKIKVDLSVIAIEILAYAILKYYAILNLNGSPQFQKRDDFIVLPVKRCH